MPDWPLAFKLFQCRRPPTSQDNFHQRSVSAPAQARAHLLRGKLALSPHAAMEHFTSLIDRRHWFEGITETLRGLFSPRVTSPIPVLSHFRASSYLCLGSPHPTDERGTGCTQRNVSGVEEEGRLVLERVKGQRQPRSSLCARISRRNTKDQNARFIRKLNMKSRAALRFKRGFTRLHDCGSPIR
ncbi:hypothetical protein LPJGGPFB_05239 [Ensifer adhaerens]|uniref:Uncharacterized protein n=1 Tax=Ensifer adhaerens TaxID=106592 RepID=A0ACC5T5Z9_ENSAD|nr:hypothetical protein [Ensifer adhaerens]NRP21980.1 hypothetical protein [Ensifer adhaerens]